MPRTENGTGYQNTDTSRDAAETIRPSAATIRIRVLAALHASILPLSSEEIAEKIDIPYCSVQPRLSELRNANRVRDSGVRRQSRYGKNIIAWELN